MSPKSTLAVLTGALLLGLSGTAAAAPAGAEGPENCTFSGGVTTCKHVGEPVDTTNVSDPDPQTGCVTTTVTTTTTTSYTAHRGTFNSSGAKVAAPADDVDSSSTSTEDCPPPPPPPATAQVKCEDLGYNYSEPAKSPNGYDTFWICDKPGMTHAEAVTVSHALVDLCRNTTEGTLSGQIVAEDVWEWNSTFTGFNLVRSLSSCVKVQR